MWILTPDSCENALVNLQHFGSFGVEQVDEKEFALLAFFGPHHKGDFVIIKRGDNPEELNSIALGIYSCVEPHKGLPLCPMTTPTLH